MGATAAIVLAGFAYVTYTTMEHDTADRALVDQIFRPLSSPPARLVVCKGAMDAACAQETADRLDTTIAWLDDPAGYELEWMFATADPVIPDEGVVAVQYFVTPDGHGMFEVLTSVPPLVAISPPPQPRRSISNGTDTGSSWMAEASGTASVEWTHEGITYLITAVPRPWDPSAVVDAWKTVQYATPRHS
jgi:hypothetical protein